MKKLILSTLLTERRQPFMAEAHTALLDEACSHSTAFGLLLLTDRSTHVLQKAELFARLVRSEVEKDELVSHLHSLPVEELLRVLNVLGARRINGRRAREVGVCALLRREELPTIVAHHRGRVVRIFKHLLGERTWSSVARHLMTMTEEGERFLHQHLLRFAADSGFVREALSFLTETERPFEHVKLKQSAETRKDLQKGKDMPRQTLFGIRGTFHPTVPTKNVRALSAVPARQPLQDGPLTFALKEALTDHSTEYSFARLVAEELGKVEAPTVDCTVTVVLDMSASAISSGERLYHPAALGLALVGRLERIIAKVNVLQVGGTGEEGPRPAGVTDLAGAVIEAARSAPDAIFVITDGYECLRQGDTAQVVAGLRRLGLMMPVLQIVPVVAMAEKLSARRLGENIPVMPVEHERLAGELVAQVLLSEDREESVPYELIEKLLSQGA